MNPSWYDVLDVDATASADEIRTAWKNAIAELDPTDRRFRTLNQAAEVLLDEESRAAYDRSLAPVVDEPVNVAPAEETPLTHATPPKRTDSVSAPRGVPSWLLIGLAVATLLFVGLSVWQANKNDDPSSSSSSLSSNDAGEAQAAAEKAAVAITAYDFRDLDGSRAKAIPFMTADYRKKYDQLFAVLKENAPNTKTIVTTQLVTSAVGLIGDDRIQVLVFFDRATTNAVVTEPEITRDQATFTMADEDGEWLVDDLTTTIPGS